jgi:hypothetical protein
MTYASPNEAEVAVAKSPHPNVQEGRLFTDSRGVHMGITEPTAIICELSHLKTLASFGAVLCSVN